jgi:hypothetical protein
MRENNMVYDRPLTNRGQQQAAYRGSNFPTFPQIEPVIIIFPRLALPISRTAMKRPLIWDCFYLRFTQIYLLERPKVRSFKCTRRMVP